MDCCSSASRPATPIVQATCSAAPVRWRSCCWPRQAPSGGSIGPMPHIQTVLGPIDPAEVGFTLPHEHTQIALWQIEGRWDYWQLTRDQPLILDELSRFRAAEGSALVDLTLPGVGRDPGWLRDLAEASGLHLVMG